MTDTPPTLESGVLFFTDGLFRLVKPGTIHNDPMRYIIGIIVIIVGFLFVWKSDWLMNNFGRVEFAERYLGSGWGGTRIFYKLLGVAIIILAFMYMSGTIESILNGIFGRSREVLGP